MHLNIVNELKLKDKKCRNMACFLELQQITNYQSPKYSFNAVTIWERNTKVQTKKIQISKLVAMHTWIEKSSRS